MTLHEKFDKENKKLNALLEQKNELEQKIQKQQKVVDNLDAMIKQKAYKETDELLVKNNITLDMLREALEKGDLSALQNAMSDASKGNEEKATTDTNETVTSSSVFSKGL